MVGTFMLLKILHCRRAGRGKKSRHFSSDEATQQKSDLSVSVKIETVDDTQTCRVCLKGGMIPIYGSNKDKEETDLSEALRTFAGLYIYANDEYPKYLCQSCHDLLKGAILLRRTAQQSEEKLRCQSQIGTKANYSASDNHLSENYDHSGDFDAPIVYRNVTVSKEEIYKSKPGNLTETNNHSDSDNHLSDNDDSTDLDTPNRYRRVIVSKEDVYQCKPCSLDFGSYEDYIDHRLSAEHENKRHTCPICNNTYASIYFKRHLAIHKHEKTYMCDVCGKEFVSQNHFSRHRLTHFYALPFKCSLCPYRGRFTESLKMHMRSHTGEKPYQCTACPSRFVNKSNLNKHMFTHKGTHDFKCEDCGRGFYTKRALELHFKVDHTGIKDHRCNICNKVFGYRKQMMKHQLRVHKRDKLRSGRLPLYLQVQTQKAKEQQKD